VVSKVTVQRRVPQKASHRHGVVEHRGQRHQAYRHQHKGHQQRRAVVFVMRRARAAGVGRRHQRRRRRRRRRARGLRRVDEHGHSCCRWRCRCRWLADLKVGGGGFTVGLGCG